MLISKVSDWDRAHLEDFVRVGMRKKEPEKKLDQTIIDQIVDMAIEVLPNTRNPR